MSGTGNAAFTRNLLSCFVPKMNPCQLFWAERFLSGVPRDFRTEKLLYLIAQIEKSQCQYVIIRRFVFGIKRNVTTNVCLKSFSYCRWLWSSSDHETTPPTPYRTLLCWQCAADGKYLPLYAQVVLSVVPFLGNTSADYHFCP